MKTEPTRDSADEIGEEAWRAEAGPHATVPAPRQRRAWPTWLSIAGGVVAVVALVAAHCRAAMISESEVERNGME